jgi:sugar phosphate isomerase/epimerase
MILSGIADEAGKDIETQVKAHKELGWDHIELRLIDGRNIAGELPEEGFDRVRNVLEENKMRVTAFASAIGNWSRHINDDFSCDRNDLKVSIGRMKKVDVKYIRIMSWKGKDVDNNQWFKEAVRRSKELAKMAEDAGIYLLHENCEGWGGLSAANMLKLKQAVDSPHFLLLYDLGNTISHGYEPRPFFETIRGKFAYIHIKDAKNNPRGGCSQDFKYCGEGDAMLKQILAKIIREDGYDGVISIEPHVAGIVHLNRTDVPPQRMYASYLGYGQRFKTMIKKIRGQK